MKLASRQHFSVTCIYPTSPTTMGMGAPAIPAGGWTFFPPLLSAWCVAPNQRQANDHCILNDDKLVARNRKIWPVLRAYCMHQQGLCCCARMNSPRREIDRLVARNSFTKTHWPLVRGVGRTTGQLGRPWSSSFSSLQLRSSGRDEGLLVSV
jgi:hypothetical protein